jgi:hypothetical protein
MTLLEKLQALATAINSILSQVAALQTALTALSSFLDTV